MKNPTLTRLTEWMREGKLPRREFIRQATLLGLAAPAAYSLAGLVQPARAQSLPRGGTLTMAMRVMDVSNPHAISFDEGGFPIRVCVDHLTRTAQDNITRPWLLQGWDVSDDLRTWTLNLRPGVNWANGRAFTSEDVAWNVSRVLDPATGSSILGLMSGYMLNEIDTGETDDDGNPVMSSELWDANAIEVVDDLTVRLNLKTAETACPSICSTSPSTCSTPKRAGPTASVRTAPAPTRWWSMRWARSR
jgi:peptide/nickel transport system substrate-binding protein